MGSEYGNVSWGVFVTAAYGISFLILAVYTLWAAHRRRKALLALVEEGILQEPLHPETDAPPHSH